MLEKNKFSFKFARNINKNSIASVETAVYMYLAKSVFKNLSKNTIDERDFNIEVFLIILFQKS